jgi:arylsulfatase A
MPIPRRDFLSLPALAAAVQGVSGANTLPNVILIFCDDLGYGDLGCYGSKIRTPNLDRLASEGIRFTHFYSANPVCSPSRAALLTGRYPTRVGVPVVLFPPDPGGLNEDESTLADLLKKQGYQTMCIGKWHLGRPEKYLPTSRGFDHYFGIPYSNDMTPRPLMRDTQVIEDTAKLETLTPRYTDEAVKFIDAAKGKPFFLYMPHTYPHIPLGASAKFRGKSPLGIYGDVVEEIDWSVGEVVRALKRNGLERNTLIIFSSDNGPWYQGSPGPLRGRKGMTWEGGVRVPCIMSMPGRLPKGRVTDSVASTLDIVPTVTALCGAPRPSKPIDGIDLWPLLSGKVKSIERQEVLLYFDNVHLQCARWKHWKLHVARYNNVTYSPAPAIGRKSFPLSSPELYNLTTDPAESYDVAEENPAVVKEILTRIEKLIPGFPSYIAKAWQDQKALAAAKTPAGAVTRPR